MWKNKGQFLPQRREICAAAFAILVLTVAGAAYVLIPPVQSWFRGILMLFSQRSVHTLVGAIRASGAGGFVAVILLTLFQMVLLPNRAPLVFLAAPAALGQPIGWVSAWIGALFGSGLCFCISRCLLRPVVRRLEPHQIRDTVQTISGGLTAATVLLLPSAPGIAAYLIGATAVRPGRYLLWTALSHMILLGIYTQCCNLLRTSLPHPAQLALGAVAIIWLLGSLFLLRFGSRLHT